MNNNEIFIEVSALPEPLPKAELIECITLAHQGDSKARNKAVHYNIRLVIHHVLNKFQCSSYEKNELVSIGLIGLVKAVDTFDPSKNFEFATYAVKCINNEILMFIKKNDKHLVNTSLYSPLNNTSEEDFLIEEVIPDTKIDIEMDYEEKELICELKKHLELLSEKEKEVLKLFYGFYGKRYTQVEIAKMLEMSQGGISRIISRATNALKIAMQNGGYIIKPNRKPQSYTLKPLNTKLKEANYPS